MSSVAFLVLLSFIVMRHFCIFFLQYCILVCPHLRLFERVVRLPAAENHLTLCTGIQPLIPASAKPPCTGENEDNHKVQIYIEYHSCAANFLALLNLLKGKV